MANSYGERQSISIRVPMVKADAGDVKTNAHAYLSFPLGALTGSFILPILQLSG
jgi:hypothetical protein